MSDTGIPPVQLGRIALTDQQLRATEIALYRAADLIDRLMVDGGVPYTKVIVPQAAPPQPVSGVPYGQPPPPLGPAPTAPPTSSSFPVPPPEGALGGA